uniref:Uncharacterized protein n=1 Tax=Parascaris equorum TaxID=6256 RepID=A0A914SIL4_PAREQ
METADLKEPMQKVRNLQAIGFVVEGLHKEVAIQCYVCVFFPFLCVKRGPAKCRRLQISDDISPTAYMLQFLKLVWKKQASPKECEEDPHPVDAVDECVVELLQKVRNV